MSCAERVSKAKAFIAVKNYNAAIYELENIRRETNDPTVHGVVNVLLMNSYLEQGDYKRAQAFLKRTFQGTEAQQAERGGKLFRGRRQVVKGARNQLERYKSLGLTVSDRNLPPKPRLPISKKCAKRSKWSSTQSKTLSEDKKQTSDALALLEEAIECAHRVWRVTITTRSAGKTKSPTRANGLIIRAARFLTPRATSRTNTVAANLPTYTNSPPTYAALKRKCSRI